MNEATGKEARRAAAIARSADRAAAARAVEATAEEIAGAAEVKARVEAARVKGCVEANKTVYAVRKVEIAEGKVEFGVIRMTDVGARNTFSHAGTVTVVVKAAEKVTRRDSAAYVASVKAGNARVAAECAEARKALDGDRSYTARAKSARVIAEGPISVRLVDKEV